MNHSILILALNFSLASNIYYNTKIGEIYILIIKLKIVIRLKFMMNKINYVNIS